MSCVIDDSSNSHPLDRCELRHELPVISLTTQTINETGTYFPRRNMAAIVETKSDVESNGEKKDVVRGYVGADGVHQEDFAAGTSTYARLQRLAGKFGVEQRGIERVPDDERVNDAIANVGTLVSLSSGDSTSHQGSFLTGHHITVVQCQHGGV